MSIIDFIIVDLIKNKKIHKISNIDFEYELHKNNKVKFKVFNGIDHIGYARHIHKIERLLQIKESYSFHLYSCNNKSLILQVKY